jgi:hypothetical protein
MFPQNEGNPSELIDLAEEVQRGFGESGKLPERLKRYSFARERALINVSQIQHRINAKGDSLFVRNLQKIRPRIATCGDYLVFKHYYTIDKVRLTAAMFCRVHLLCPLCAVRRGSKSLQAYLDKFELIKAEHPTLRLSMLTLTVKNGDDLEERYQHLRKSLKTMLARRRHTLAGQAGYHSEFAKIAGLVGSIEITKDGGKGLVKDTGWHPHAHLMVLHDRLFNFKALKAEWFKITGDSHVLNVAKAKHPNDPAQDFLEVFKYALKFSDLTPEQNLQAYEVMRGARLLFSAGLFWGVEVPEDLTDIPMDELPYIELFYRYLPNSGYNLTKRRESDSKIDVDTNPKRWELLRAEE